MGLYATSSISWSKSPQAKNLHFLLNILFEWVPEKKSSPARTKCGEISNVPFARIGNSTWLQDNHLLLLYTCLDYSQLIDWKDPWSQQTGMEHRCPRFRLSVLLVGGAFCSFSVIPSMRLFCSDTTQWFQIKSSVGDLRKCAFGSQIFAPSACCQNSQIEPGDNKSLVRQKWNVLLISEWHRLVSLEVKLELQRQSHSIRRGMLCWSRSFGVQFIHLAFWAKCDSQKVSVYILSSLDWQPIPFLEPLTHVTIVHKLHEWTVTPGNQLVAKLALASLECRAVFMSCLQTPIISFLGVSWDRTKTVCLRSHHCVFSCGLCQPDFLRVLRAPERRRSQGKRGKHGTNIAQNDTQRALPNVQGYWKRI